LGGEFNPIEVEQFMEGGNAAVKAYWYRDFRPEEYKVSLKSGTPAHAYFLEAVYIDGRWKEGGGWMTPGHTNANPNPNPNPHPIPKLKPNRTPR